MADDAIQIRLVLVSQDQGSGHQDRDSEHAEADLQDLIDELSRLDAATITREPAKPSAPDRRSAAGWETAGALLIALGGSGASLPVLIGLVRDWLKRRGSGAIRLKIGEDEVELTGVSDALQQRLLDEFLRRHRVIQDGQACTGHR